MFLLLNTIFNWINLFSGQFDRDQNSRMITDLNLLIDCVIDIKNEKQPNLSWLKSRQDKVLNMPGYSDESHILMENAENEAEDGVTVNAELKDNHILISKFPVEDLIKSIIEDPDAAEAIIKAVGDVEYKIPYQAAFNDNKDNILLQMSPEPLVLEIAMEPQPIRKTEGEEETPKIPVKVTI